MRRVGGLEEEEREGRVETDLGGTGCKGSVRDGQGERGKGD